MATKVRFLIRQSKDSGLDATIFARLTDGRKSDIRVNTTLSCPNGLFDEKAGFLKDCTLQDESVVMRMESLEYDLKAIRSLLILGYTKNEVFEKKDAEDVISEYLKSKQKKAAAIPTDVVGYIAYFVEGMKAGKILNRGNQYDANTVKMWNTFLKIMQRFHAYYSFSWDDIDKHLYDKFLCWLEGEGYMVKTINKYAGCFRAAISYSIADKVHSNMSAEKVCYQRKVKDGETSAKIYLTAKEVEALYNMKLGGLKGQIRDVFLCGVYTCQRFSDYSRLQKECFGVTSKGTRVVRLTQEKTGNKVVIPILNENLVRIAERYDFDLPKVSDVVLNRYIKDILKDLAESVPSLHEMVRTVLTMREMSEEKEGKRVFQRDRSGNVIKPRYELVSSHTARRTGITNLYLLHIYNTMQMMSISGHKTEGNFLEYIKLSSDEIAEEIEKMQNATNNLPDEMF